VSTFALYVTVKTATPAKPAWPFDGVASERLRAYLRASTK